MTQPSAAGGKGVESAPKTAADRVREWLDQHGAALELKVASQFLTSYSKVEHSGYFRDVETGKLREFDVHATFRGRGSPRTKGFTVHVVAECKATSAPWVLYKSSDSSLGARDWDFEEFFEFSSWRDKTIRHLDGFPFAPLFRVDESHAYQLADTGTKDNSRGFDAGHQLLDALEGICVGHKNTASANSDTSWTAPDLRIYVPVLVTGSRLFKVGLGPSGEVDIEETQVAAWLFNRRRKTDGEIVRRLIWVVHQDAVDHVVNKVVRCLERLTLTERPIG